MRSRDIKYVRVANVSKMASYTLILLKNFAARPKGEGLFHCKEGGGEKFKGVGKYTSYHCVPYVRASSELTARLCFTGAQLAGLATKCLLPGQLPTCTCRTGLRNRTVRRAMAKRVRCMEWRQIYIQYVRVAKCTKLPPTPLYCSKNSLRGLEEKVFSLQRGEAKNLKLI